MPELQPELEHALAAAEEEEGEGNGGPDGNPLGDAAAAGAAARADDAEGGLQQGVLVPEGLDGAGVARVVGAGEARRRAEEWLAVGGLGPVARLTRCGFVTCTLHLHTSLWAWIMYIELRALGACAEGRKHLVFAGRVVRGNVACGNWLIAASVAFVELCPHTGS